MQDANQPVRMMRAPESIEERAWLGTARTNPAQRTTLFGSFVLYEILCGMQVADMWRSKCSPAALVGVGICFGAVLACLDV